MSLRDQMLKAGLITEEQARQTAHKQRVESKRTDRKTKQQRQEAARNEVRQQQEAERARHREQSRERQQAEAQREQGLQERQRRTAAIEAAYREGELGKWEGARRYYYAAHGRVDWLMVTDDVARRLEQGQAAIVAGERNAQRHVPLKAAAARKLAELEPARLLVLHEG